MTEIVKLRVRVPTNNSKRIVTIDSATADQGTSQTLEKTKKKKSHSRYFSNNLEAAYEHGVASLAQQPLETSPISPPNDIYKTTFQIRNDTSSKKKFKKQEKPLIVPMKSKQHVIAAPPRMIIPKTSLFKPLCFTIVNDRFVE